MQLVIKGGCQSTCIAGQPKSRRSAGTNVPAGTLALVRSPLALRCSREQNALHTLIHQRHLTPSCRGQAPTAERTLDPARMFAESLNLDPELENALHTLIHQRHLTPSCRGQAPTAERTLDPARMFAESLNLDPELENSQGQSLRIGTPAMHAQCPLLLR